MADDIRTCGDLDERLAAYVDGEDSSAAHRAVDAHLAACPACRAAADAEASARQLIQERRAELAARAPEALRARCAASFQLPAGSQRPAAGSRLPASGSQLPAGRPVSFVRRWAPLSIAATLVLAIAGVFAFGLNDRVQALAASLAMDHAKCFKLAGTSGHADAHASERAWQQDQGWPIVVPDTDASQQLTLLELRRCLSADGRAAHMLYTWHGEPLSLYVLQGGSGRDAVVHKMGAQTVMWHAHDRTYAVVSADLTQNLTPIVDYLKARVK
jgi:anti-sigma factor RsiW